MFLRKVMASLVALTCVAIAQPSRAAQQTFASAAADGANISTAYAYTTGVGGGLSITPNSTFLASSAGFVPDAAATLTVTGMTNVGTVVVGPTDVQNLTGGSFTLKAGNGVTVLLSGTFTSAQLTAAPPLPQSQASLFTNLVDITYTGGTYFGASGLINPGGFSFGLTSANPTITIQPSGYFNSFAAGGAGTFSATATGVPLPRGAALGLTALPMLAFGMWMRRKQLASL